jgi:hypothetical protein
MCLMMKPVVEAMMANALAGNSKGGQTKSNQNSDSTSNDSQKNATNKEIAKLAGVYRFPKRSAASTSYRSRACRSGVAARMA